MIGSICRTEMDDKMVAPRDATSESITNSIRVWAQIVLSYWKFLGCGTIWVKDVRRSETV